MGVTCSTSPCLTPAYKPSKVPITSARAAESLVKKLQDTYMYRFASSFCRVWLYEIRFATIECYCFHLVPGHVQCGEFPPPAPQKRIHFSTKVPDEDEPCCVRLGRVG